MGLSLEALDPPLDDIAYLSRSNHRVRVLSELARESATRGDLRDAIDVSQPTLGRILDGFEERGWLTETDRRYALTPFGRLVAEEFEALMETVETIQQLRELVPRLPLDHLDFDLRLLADARITTPSESDATAHVRREEKLARQAKRISFFCNSAHPYTVEVYRHRVVEEGQHLDAVIAADAMEAASADPTMRDHLRDILESDRSTIYRYEGHVPVMVGLMDETATIAPLDEAGVSCGLIETENDTIREWVEETIEAYRAEAHEVTPAQMFAD